jgi:uncharacterized protein (DUF2249 family)
MNFAGRVDAREYERKDKQRVIFEIFDSLEPGQYMELINDHDPVRLKETRFEIDKKDEYTWEYLESGPEVWRIAIGKKQKN